MHNPSMHSSQDMACIKKRDGSTDGQPESNKTPQLRPSWGHKNELINGSLI